MTHDGPPAVDTAQLAAWLGDLLGAPVGVDTLTVAQPSGGGWSNDTLLVATHVPGCERVVVRLAPTGPAMFPAYDLTHQVAVMREVASAGAVPVPAILGVDDGARLGRTAFVMAFVPGRVPVDDRPSFAETGFVFEATVAEQRTFHEALVDAIADVHATTFDAPAASSVAAALETLGATWAFDRGAHGAPVVDDALEALASDVPASSGDVRLWGDARPANVVVADDGFRPTALLDWELSTVGPPELDITWLAEMNRMRMEGSGVARLPGFLTDDEAVERYEARTGRTLRDLGWYRLLSATRVAVLMHRHLRVMVHVGRLPADHRLLTRTIATERVAALLDRPIQPRPNSPSTSG